MNIRRGSSFQRAPFGLRRKLKSRQIRNIRTCALNRLPEPESFESEACNINRIWERFGNNRRFLGLSWTFVSDEGPSVGSGLPRF